MIELCECCKPNCLNLPEGLPNNLQYILCENNHGDDGISSVVLRCVGHTENDAKSWLENYSKETRTVWRVQCGHKESGRKNVFKTEYRCLHNTRHKRSGSAKRKPSLISKNMECPAKLTIIVKRVPKRCRSSDKHLPKYPMLIQLKNSHNHSPDCEASLRHRDVSSEVRLKFESLYQEQRHSPGSALATHLHDLHQEHGDDVFAALTDRAICPDRGWCYSLYYKLFNKEYAEKGGVDEEISGGLESFGAVLQQYSKQFGPRCARLICVDNSEFACAIITPLMKRNHLLNFQAGEVCYIETSGKTDRDRSGVKLYQLMCDSEAGGIPLGLLAVSSESERVLYEALLQYRELLEDTMHFGKGQNGPQVFMTEDCIALRNALTAVFSTSALLLSSLHIIQSSWRFLCSHSTGVPSSKRTQLMTILKKLLLSETEEELESIYIDSVESSSELTHQYAKFQEYLRIVFNRRHLWSPSLFQPEISAKNYSASELCDIAMRVLRDVMLHRLRSYALPQMAHFIFTRLDEYYGRRLQDVVNDRPILAAHRRFLVGKTPIPADNVTQLSSIHYKVSDGNSKLTHEIDVSVGTCSCMIGTSSSAPCKHQFAVVSHWRLHNLLPSPEQSSCSTNGKIMLYEIATGNRIDIPDNWFKQQHAESEVGVSVIQKVDDSSEHCVVMDETTSDLENQEVVEEHTQETLHKFTTVFSKLKDKFLKDPSLYGPALERFCSTIEAMPSDSSIVPALTNFGKYGTNKECSLDLPLGDWFH